ncbi:proton extrusion protein PcxA [Thermosynechococcus vestitus]|uniref:Proton extrusion protein PxcA n=1 Tax=Thermosynechococcus vestitus (strain NIES-2133 / IAM M-273 / BP-1) TaxID=197221 RepID=PXCA_THEVB|nr:proton extrusion protein PcxA [Thermosynechococcus vestitus]P59112.1 RecName: Full=Proton extrusion protein PxcA [Thermosynechococcus vestitus BP-1]BAC08299.1 proton transport protein [Thermosynechococcus vestitus BP-1]BAY52118.1 proton transport protein [Thermostichus vulcanus NIES-2134]
MSSNPFIGLRNWIRGAQQWYLTTPKRALQEAYEAALKIRAIELEHFDGQPISPLNLPVGEVSSYFETELKQLLKTIRMRMMEFRASRQILPLAPFQSPPTPVNEGINGATETYTVTATVSSTTAEPSVYEKLRVIDATLNRYKRQREKELDALARPSLSRQDPQQRQQAAALDKIAEDSLYLSEYISDDLTSDSKLDSSSFIPRSILRTADRFRRELNSDEATEAEVVRDFRTSKLRTRLAVRFMLLLVILPLLTQQISKALIVSPLVNHFKAVGQIERIINSQLEDNILDELARFENKIRFESLVSNVPIAPEEIQNRIREKAIELSTEYQKELIEPLKNILSDALGFTVFLALVFTGQRQLAIVKTFLDEVVYGLSDSAKAFMIILFTDVFVGFHSPHGWEVLVNNTLEHFGFPRNEDFINMFIATFPVMLDTVFKYWIFRYLNQISPSAVATYKNMNE